MTTLCYIEKDDSYLMMHRTVKKNDVNKDKWIGVGGHAELGESPEECLLREVKEETGYTLTSWRFRGLVTFVTEAENSKTVEYMEYMCLYTADGFTGEPTACDEGELAWVKKEDVLHLNLWEGDKIFFRLHCITIAQPILRGLVSYSSARDRPMRHPPTTSLSPRPLPFCWNTYASPLPTFRRTGRSAHFPSTALCSSAKTTETRGACRK